MILAETDKIPIEERKILGRPIIDGEQKIPKKFNKKWEYGSGIVLKSMRDKKGIDYLHAKAKSVLPKGTPYELRLQKSSHNFPEKSHPFVAAWYYHPYMKNKNGIPTTRWKFSMSDGVWIRGMFKA